jgi:hypothetical protein
MTFVDVNVSSGIDEKVENYKAEFFSVHFREGGIRPNLHYGH